MKKLLIYFLISAISLVAADSPYQFFGLDASYRTRVSQLTTTIDGKLTGGNYSLNWTSAGTGTISTAASKTTLTVTSGQYCVWQSKRYAPYLAGKSSLVECTFDQFAPQSGVTKMVGYYSSTKTAPYASTYDGFWLESGNGTITFKMKNNDNSILSLDITRWSGYEDLRAYKTMANWDNFTVVAYDFLWLGGAVCRVWIKDGQKFIIAHQFDYPSTAQGTMINTPCQPIRYEIRSTSGSGAFRYICSQAASEGSIDGNGYARSVNSTSTGITCSSIGTTYPIKAVRKQAAFRNVPVELKEICVLLGSINDRGLYTVQINPTLSAPLTYSDVTNSSFQEAAGNGTITVSSSGTTIMSGHVTQNTPINNPSLQASYLSFLGCTVADVMDEYVLCFTPSTATVTTHGSMTVKEY